MYQERNSLQKALSMMKANLVRTIAAVFFLLAAILLFIMIAGWMRLLLKEGQETFTAAWWVAILLTAVVALLILMPLELGIKRWFYLLCFDEDCSMESIFYYFHSGKQYFHALLFRIGICLRRLLTYAATLSPSVLLSLTALALGRNFGASAAIAVLSVLSGIALAFGVIIGLSYNLRYHLAEYLFFSDNRCRVRKASNISVGLMKSKRADLAGCYLSLFPFYLSCLLVLPLVLLIPMLYVLTAVKSVEFLNQDNKGKNMFSGAWYIEK